MTEVRLRSDGERGVFATKKFYKGELVCKMPLHSVTINGNCFYTSKECFYNSDYNIDYNNNIYFSSDPINESDGVGHLINDGYSKGDSCYWIKSYEKENVIPIQDVRCSKGVFYYPIIATRLINPDEELFFSYGIDYWKDRQKPKNRLNKLNGRNINIKKISDPADKTILTKLVKKYEKEAIHYK